MSSLRLRPTRIGLTTAAGLGVDALDQRAAAGRDPDRGRARRHRQDPVRVGDRRADLARLRVDPDELVRLVVAGDERRPRSRRRPRASALGRNGSLIGLPIGLPVRASRRTSWFDARDRDPDRVAADDGVADAEPDLRARRRATLPVLASTMRHAVAAEGADEDVVARDADDVRAPADRDPLDDLGRGRRRWRSRCGCGVAVGVALAASPPRASSPSASAAITPTAAASSEAGGDAAPGRRFDGVAGRAVSASG